MTFCVLLGFSITVLFCHLLLMACISQRGWYEMSYNYEFTCTHHCIYTVWHENLTVIKFYDFSKLLKYKKSMDFKFYGNLSNLISLQHNSKS